MEDTLDKGPPLQPETVQYFRKIKETLEENDFESDEDRQILLENVHEEIYGHEFRLSVNKSCSLVLEQIMSMSTALQLRSYFYNLTTLLCEVACDRKGSHVLQAALKRVPSILIEEFACGETEVEAVEEEEAEEQVATPPSMTIVFRGTCEELKESWLDLMYDAFGSHIVRDVICICAGHVQLFSKQDASKRPKQPEISSQHLGPLKGVLPSILGAVSSQTKSDIADMLFDNAGSHVVQLLVETASRRSGAEEEEETEGFIARLLLWNQSENGAWEQDDASKVHVNSLLKSRVGSHALEKIVECAPPASCSRLARFHFLPQLSELAQDPVANFSVQKLLQHSDDKGQILACLTSLQNNLQTLLRTRAGVVRWLVAACQRAQVGQKTVVKALISAAGISNPNDNRSVVQRLLTMGSTAKSTSSTSNSNSNSFHPVTARFSPMGCAMLQSLSSFPFEAVGRVVDSFLALDGELLLRAALDGTASRAVEAFLDSPTFHFHVKHKLLDKFNGKFAVLADGRFGSFVLEKAFQVANKSRKVTIATELSVAEDRLGRATRGRIMLTNLKISLFKRAPHIWEERMHSVEKTKSLFADILGDDGDAAKRSAKVRCKETKQEVSATPQTSTKKKEKPKQKKEQGESEVGEVPEAETKKKTKKKEEKLKGKKQKRKRSEGEEEDFFVLKKKKKKKKKKKTAEELLKAAQALTV